MKNPLYLAIMGTMGAGKSTAAKILAKSLKFQLLEENFGENAFLPKFYEDMSRWAFHSQTFFLMEKINQILTTKDLIVKQSVIQDVPIYQDVFSYAKAQNILGHMNDVEWKLYIKIFHSFLPMIPKPTHILYIKTRIDTVKERMRKRNRDFEKQVPEGYLELLEMLNERFLKKEADGIKVVTIETDTLNLVKSDRDKKKFVDLARKAL